MYYFLGINDILFTPVYLLLTVIAIIIYSRRVKKENKSYFFWGISMKILFAILFGLVYEFYYKGGDTSGYFFYGRIIGETLFTAPLTWLQLMVAAPYSPELAPYIDRIVWYTSDSAYFPCRIVGLLSPFCMHTYSVIAIYYAIIAFSGVWVMFLTLINLFPNVKKQLAFAILFFPSTLFWGSGIMKDSLCLSALGWMFFAFYNIFIAKRRRRRDWLILVLSAYVIIIVKIYILVCFAPAAVIWLLIEYNNKIKNVANRKFLKPILFFLGIGIGAIISNYITLNSHYSLDNLEKTSKITREWISYASNASNGSTYNIGEVDFSFVGLLKIFPAGVNVSLFRPYLWEAKNIFVFISALESVFVLILTIQILFKPGIVKTIEIINRDPCLVCLIIFAISFAFAVGISTNNFGALVRYKIPLVPFYVSALFIIKNYQFPKTEMQNKKKPFKKSVAQF